MISTLSELIRFIDDSATVPVAHKRYLRSALNRARALIGNGADDVLVEPRMMLRRLDQLSPAMAGMAPQSYANLKSRVRTALRHAAPHLAPARSHTKLTGAWAIVEARLPLRERRQLSRLLRFLQGIGCAPEQVGEEHALAFEQYLEHDAMLPGREKVVRDARRAWNRSVDAVPGWPKQRLAPPRSKHSPYWLRLNQLPASLQQQVADHLHRIANPDPFLGPSREGLAPTTVEQHRILFVTLASALVATGIPPGELTTIASLVRPDHLERALRFLHARAGGRVNDQIYQITYRVRRIAAHAGLSQQELARLDQIAASVKREYPAEHGLTAKNRRLLEHFDDPAFVDRLVTLPARLAQAARRTSDPRRAASLARDAVVAELLLTCTMRLGNLADLRVGETIRRFGEGRDARWVIDLPAEKVKNRQPLRYTLLPESGQLVEWYLATWHHRWSGPASPWLFPAKGGGHVDSRLLTIMIKTRTRQYVGVNITCHQFRHLAAELYLRDDPSGIGVVGQHLGHKSFNTTRRFYAREQTRTATQRYHQVLTRRRARATCTPRARGRAKPAGRPK